MRWKHRTSKSLWRRGFTLVEIMMTLGAMSVVSATAIPMVEDLINKGRYSAAHQEIEIITVALESFHAKNRQYPLANQGQVASEDVLFSTGNLTFTDGGVAPTLGTRTTAWNAASRNQLAFYLGNDPTNRFGGPYMIRDVPDPWGRPYMVSVGGYKCIPQEAPAVTGLPTQTGGNSWNVWVLSAGRSGILSTQPADIALVAAGEVNVGKRVFRQRANCLLN